MARHGEAGEREGTPQEQGQSVQRQSAREEASVYVSGRETADKMEEKETARLSGIFRRLLHGRRLRVINPEPFFSGMHCFL